MSAYRRHSAILHKHYRTTNKKVRLYNFLRLSIFPVDWLSEIISTLPAGTVLCLGCGYGTLETIFAVQNPHLKFIASDLQQDRIAHASESLTDVPNITFTAQDVTKLKDQKQYDAIIYIDLMHHLAKGEQEKLITKLWSMLRPGGTILMKDVGTRPRWKYYWNYLHDSLMAGQPLTYHPVAFYQDYYTKLGGDVLLHYPTSFHSPYNHYALVVQKP